MLFLVVMINNDFNPRAPCGARPYFLQRHTYRARFQPTRPLRGATAVSVRVAADVAISTHAPLAGRDQAGRLFVGRRLEFQPTRPLRGATITQALAKVREWVFQPTRPLRGATRPARQEILCLGISTHAPLAGRDSKSVQITMHIFAITDKFQMLLHRMPPVRAFCSFLMQENHADFGCEPPK